MSLLYEENKWYTSRFKTKGEQPFANIVREQFMLQQPIKKDSSLPNEGRKVLLFSDGRQKQRGLLVIYHMK